MSVLDGDKEVIFMRKAKGNTDTHIQRAWNMRGRPRRSGAAWCALGSFGGGFLGGDEVDLKIEVAEGATLAMTTQASTKIYQAKADGRPAVQRVGATVGAGGLLVMAPDPLVPFADSPPGCVAWRRLLRSYAQELDFQVQGSAVVVDWLQAGRVAQGERWAFRRYASRVSFPGLVEALRLRPEDLSANFDSVATVFVVGPRGEPVAQRLGAVARALAKRRGCRVEADAELPQLQGASVMGVSCTSAGCTARLVAEKTEERLFVAGTTCLRAISEHFPRLSGRFGGRYGHF